MSKLTSCRFILALVAASAWMAADSAFGESEARKDIHHAVVPSTQKVFPDTIPEGEDAVKLTAAIGEYVSFQVALRADRVTTLTLSTDLPGSALYEAIYIATPGVAQWGYPEEFPEHRRAAYPDPLVPANKIVLEPDVTKSLWVRIKAGESATGHVRAGGISVPVALDVLDFSMPGKRALPAAVGLGGQGFAGYYDVGLYSEEYWRLYEAYYDDLLEYRLTGTRLPRGMRGPRAAEYLANPLVTSAIAEYSGDREAMREMWDWIESLGALDKLWFYNLDEPDSPEEYDVVRGQVRYLNQVAPGHRYGLPFYTGLPDKSTPFDHLSGYVNLWIIQTDYYAHGHGLGDKVRSQAREHWKAGDEVWVYTALAPRGGWCNILLNHTALEHRLLFWQIYMEEVPSGYLFWQATYWDQTDDPWKDQATVKKLDPHLWGDGSLFYPGADGPVGSIRLEMIRAGLQDFELLKLAEGKIGRAGVMEYVTRLTTGVGFMNHTNDVELFEVVRAELQEVVAGNLLQ